MKLETGTKIICPNCKDVIAITATEILSGMAIHAGLFNFVQAGQRDGTPYVCRKCTLPYFDNGKLHTDRGWMPEHLGEAP